MEVLYVPDCRHHPAAVLKLKEVLAEEGIASEVREVAVHDVATAMTLQFCGSPTIRINDRDVAAELGSVQNFGVACRLYPGSNESGVPPVEMIRQAVRDARLAENP
jgi:hypothetical protein